MKKGHMIGGYSSLKRVAVVRRVSLRLFVSEVRHTKKGRGLARSLETYLFALVGIVLFRTICVFTVLFNSNRDWMRNTHERVLLQPKVRGGCSISIGIG